MKQAVNSLLRYWFPFIFYSLAILFVSTRPLAHLPPFPMNDKVMHFMEYSVYGFLLVRIFWHRLPKSRMPTALWAWLGVACFAALDETAQIFAAGRQPDVRDWAADVAGGLCGIAAYILIRRLLDRVTLKQS